MDGVRVSPMSSNRSHGFLAPGGPTHGVPIAVAKLVSIECCGWWIGGPSDGIQLKKVAVSVSGQSTAW